MRVPTVDVCRVGLGAHASQLPFSPAKLTFSGEYAERVCHHGAYSGLAPGLHPERDCRLPERVGRRSRLDGFGQI